MIGTTACRGPTSSPRTSGFHHAHHIPQAAQQRMNAPGPVIMSVGISPSRTSSWCDLQQTAVRDVANSQRSSSTTSEKASCTSAGPHRPTRSEHRNRVEIERSRSAPRLRCCGTNSSTSGGGQPVPATRSDLGCSVPISTTESDSPPARSATDFARLARRAGVEGATLHRLRHNVATFLVERGHILQAQARLGPADAATTLRKYAYALPLVDVSVADAIERHLDDLAVGDADLMPSTTRSGSVDT